jgi:hypothetical protein
MRFSSSRAPSLLKCRPQAVWTCLPSIQRDSAHKHAQTSLKRSNLSSQLLMEHESHMHSKSFFQKNPWSHQPDPFYDSYRRMENLKFYKHGILLPWQLPPSDMEVGSKGFWLDTSYLQAKNLEHAGLRKAILSSQVVWGVPERLLSLPSLEGSNLDFVRWLLLLQGTLIWRAKSLSCNSVVPWERFWSLP